MFNFGKKKLFKTEKELSPSQLLFLEKLTDNLLGSYPEFKKQFESGVITAISSNPLGRHGAYSFTLDNEKWDLLCDKAKMSFRIIGISAMSTDKSEEVKIEISTNEGLMIGLFSSMDIEKIDTQSLNADFAFEKHFSNSEIQEIEGIIEYLKPFAKKLDLSTIFKFRIKEMDYFAIKGVGDGNYLAVDKNGKVFELIHDPFKIEVVFNSLEEFVESLR